MASLCKVKFVSEFISMILKMSIYLNSHYSTIILIFLIIRSCNNNKRWTRNAMFGLISMALVSQLYWFKIY